MVEGHVAAGRDEHILCCLIQNDAIVGRQLLSETVTQRRNPCRLPVVMVVGLSPELSHGVEHLRRRRIVDDTLAQGDRLRTLSQQGRHIWDDRRLDGLHSSGAGHRFRHAASTTWSRS